MMLLLYTFLNPFGFEVEPQNSKKGIELYTTKILFSKYGWTIYIRHVSVLPLICDWMRNSTHVHVHVQARSTKTMRKLMRSSELPCFFFKIFRVSTNDCNFSYLSFISMPTEWNLMKSHFLSKFMRFFYFVLFCFLFWENWYTFCDWKVFFLSF